MDITELILDDHHEQRWLFAILEQIARSDIANLTAAWNRLAVFLDLHAESEERLVYPALLHLGRGVGGEHAPPKEAEDAIQDHNDIRAAVAEVGHNDVGSDGWYDAVSAANKANGDLMAEEESEGLTDFRRNASVTTRHRLGVKFAAFEPPGSPASSRSTRTRRNTSTNTSAAEIDSITQGHALLDQPIAAS